MLAGRGYLGSSGAFLLGIGMDQALSVGRHDVDALGNSKRAR